MTAPATTIQGLRAGDSFVLGKSQSITKNVFLVEEPDFGPRHYTPIEDDPNAERLIPDKSDPSHAIMSEISKFLESKALYDKFSVMHKRGIVLYGPPGTGKTATLKMLTNLFVEKTNGWVITNGADIDLRGTMHEIRGYDPNRAIMVVFDDVNVRQIGQDLLSLMDGQEQISNVVFVFTTNYFDTLPAALKRPSRTDLHFEIKGMTDAAAASFCKAKFGDDDFKSVKAAFAKHKVGLTYAVLKEAMLLRHVYGMTPADALKRIKNSGADFVSDDTAEADEDE
jgi:SpoVK/Ycf46/Vps4 family AAA+-type ATPase